MPLEAHRGILGPLSTPYLPAQCSEGPKGEKGESGALVSVGPGLGQGQWGLSLPLLSHAFFCIPNASQGPSGLPGSTGQKVTGLDLKGWVAERSVGSADMRKEGTSGKALAVPANTPSHSTIPKFPPRPRGKCHRPQRERSGWSGSSYCCPPSCGDEAI